MASEQIIPVKIELTSGTYFTLWAPRWRERGDEWQAFLGAGEKLFFFRSPAQLLAFLDSGEEHDLQAHPKWGYFATKSAESRAVPSKSNTFDLVGLPAVLARKPDFVAVDTVNRTLEFTKSLGMVCDTREIIDYFAHYSLLANLSRGADHYAGYEGLGEWSAVGQTVLTNWPGILDALDGLGASAAQDGTTPAAKGNAKKAGKDDSAADKDADKDAAADAASDDSADTENGAASEDAEKATANADKGAASENSAAVFIVPEDLLSEDAVAAAEEAIEAATRKREEAEKAAAEAKEEAAAEEGEESDPNADPYDSTPWAAAGIDPIKIVVGGRILYTLRCYVDGAPVFLGKYGEIYSFNSGRALVRWIVDHHDHDLGKLSTWQDLVDRANIGELKVEVHETNNYVFTGLDAAIKKGTKAVDTQQLVQAYEVLADAADWAGDDSVNSVLLAVPELQDYIAYMSGNSTSYLPTPPFDKESEGWNQLVETLTKRFSKF